MAIVLYNPTNEDMEGVYIGQVTELKSGAKVKVDDNRGKHLLSALGDRGLIPLEYGDEGEVEERKAESARKRNREFKRRQVMRYNQQNEARAQSKQPYLEPPEQIKEYAKELGLKLLEPYQFQDKTMEEMGSLKDEVAAKDRLIAKKDRDMKAMQGQMDSMQAQMDKLMSLLQGNVAAANAGNGDGDEKQEVDLVELRKKLGYKFLNTDQFETWIGRNWDKIQTAPPEIQAEIKDKYITFYDKPFPKEQPTV